MTPTWEILSTAWHRAPRLLDEGWEPFAVTINGPANDGAVTVYMRKLKTTPSVDELARMADAAASVPLV